MFVEFPNPFIKFEVYPLNFKIILNSKNMRKFTAFVFILLGFNSLIAQEDCPICEKEKEIREARAKFEEDKVFNLSHELIKEDPNNATAHFMLTYYYGLKGRRSDNEDYKMAMYDTSRMHAEKTYAIDSNTSEANYAMALAMGIVAEISGTSDKIAASKKLRYYCERSIELDPTYAKPYYILGRWHNTIANFSWFEVFLVDLLFGGTPVGASHEKALECMLTAVKYEKSFLYYHGLAGAYAELDMDEKAIEVLKEALKLPLVEIDAAANKVRCQELLEDLED